MSPTSVAIRPRPRLSESDVCDANMMLEHERAEEIISWAVEAFGPRLLMTASFADTLLIDLATQVEPDIEVVFLDTGFHFAETLDTVRRAMDRYRLNLTVLRPDASASDVWADGSEACCAARKVGPLDAHLRGNADAWLSGLRRSDSPARANTPIVMIDGRGLVKVNPIADWTDEHVASYVADHPIMVNPLANEGYSSIGCWPCTEPSVGRDGRWTDSTKTECGLHR